MTVIFSKKCELGVQAALYLSILDKDVCISAKQISEELNVPREFVSKVLQLLRPSGIVGSKKGKSGGFYLQKDSKKIRLIDIVKALDGLETFNKCALGFPDCSPSKPCPVHDKWGKLREETLRMLSEETLYELRKKTIKKISDIKKTFD